MKTEINKNALRGLHWSVGLVVLAESVLFAFGAAQKRGFTHPGLPDWFQVVRGGGGNRGGAPVSGFAGRGHRGLPVVGDLRRGRAGSCAARMVGRGKLDRLRHGSARDPLGKNTEAPGFLMEQSNSREPWNPAGDSSLISS